jgi:hypothetical protein
MLHSSPPLNFGALSAWLPYLHFVVYKNIAKFFNRITLVHLVFFFVRYFVILCVTTCFSKHFPSIFVPLYISKYFYLLFSFT